MRNIYRAYASAKLILFYITFSLLCIHSAFSQTPTITSTESICQASGTVSVTGNTLETAITGSQIPQSFGTAPIVFDQLPAGNYVVTQFAANGDETKYNISVPGNYKQNWFFSAKVQYTPCNNGVPTITIGDFKILDATSNQQRPPYKFRISANNGTLPANGGGSPAYNTPITGSFPVVAGGKYEIQAMDDCGNYKTITVNVPNSAPAPTLGSTFLDFANCDGDARYRFSGSNGNAPYNFEVKQAGTTQTPTTAGATPIYTLKAGLTYQVTITDNCGGTRTQNVTPKPYVAPSATILTSNGTCSPSGGTGSIRVLTTADGIGPLSYTLTNNCNEPALTGGNVTEITWNDLKRPCTYTVTVKDGCDKEKTLTIPLVGPGPEAMVCSETILCPSGTSELYRVRMNVTAKPPYNPTPNFLYEITKQGETTPVYTSTTSSTSYTSDGLEPGVYNLKITDDCGATCTEQITIAEYQNPTVSVDGTTECYFAGQATVIGVNNNPLNPNAYNYSIVAPSVNGVGRGSESDAPVNQGLFSNLTGGGSYTFQFNDGCKNVTTSLQMPDYDQPTWEVGFGAVCSPATSSDLVIVNLQPEGQVVGPYKWRIISEDAPAFTDPLPFPNSEGQESPIFANLPYKSPSQAATYNFLGVDGCKNSFQGSGKVGTLPEPVIVIDKNKVCEDESATLTIRPQIPVVDATYIIYFEGAPIDTSTTLFTTITNAKPGDYKIRVYPKFDLDKTCFGESPAKSVGTLGTLTVSDGEINCTTNIVDLVGLATASEPGTITFFEDEAMTVEVTNPSQATKAITYYAKFVPDADNTCESVKSFLVVNNCFGSIGNYVWLDNNNDGQQGPIASEPPLQGVTVNLLNAATNEVLQSLTTDSQGKYLFEDLPAGDYKVQFISPTGTIIAKKDQLDDATDSDNNQNGITDIITIDTSSPLGSVERDNLTIDAGFVPFGSIGDYVWQDTNYDGQQGVAADEPPVAGVTVSLLDAVSNTVLKTTQTGADGKYIFDSLLTGNYKVKFDLPANYNDITTAGTTQSGTDSDATLPNFVTATIAIDASKSPTDLARNNPTIDAGLVKYGSIGDYVWFDDNGDGQQAAVADEPPVQEVKVYLLDNTGARIDSTTTDSGGKYLFDSLKTGEYRVEFVLPVGYDGFTKPNLPDGGRNSDAQADGKTSIISIDGYVEPDRILRNNLNIDAGLLRYGSIGDYVWMDNNDDGQQGDPADEPPIQGVTVNLLNATTGQILETTTTDSQGKYLFDQLISGSYKVSFVTPQNFVTAKKDQLSDDTKDSDIDKDGLTDVVIIDTSFPFADIRRNNPQVDAGFVPVGSIGNYVWQDTNNDGQQGSSVSEPPIEGVKVYLLDDNSVRIDSAITDDNGLYLFDSLKAGSYQVQFTLPEGYENFTKGNEGNNQTDSDISDDTYTTEKVIIDPTLPEGDVGRDNLTLDAGFIKYGSLGDYVWFDKNADGVQGASEPAIEGLVVNLLDDVGTVIDTETTDINGFYEFDSLVNGIYQVKFVRPTNYDNFTKSNSGPDTRDSDAGDDGKAHLILINAYLNKSDTLRNNPNIDAGFVNYGSIGDFVWFDENADGIQDPAEEKLQGVRVYLLDDTGARIDSALTNIDGEYLFDSLGSGTYQVEFVLPDGYEDFTQTGQGTPETDSDAGTDGKSGPIVIDVTQPKGDPARDNTTVDAGVIRTGSLGDYVWFDENADGIQGADEDGIEGVTVNLLDENGGQIATTTTDANGFYEFTGLNSGDYQVEVVSPSGYEGFTTANNPADDTADSDVGTDGKSQIISIDVTREESDTLRNNPQIDAGLIRYGSIGDYVWFDADGDGTQGTTTAEPPVDGVTVELLDASGNVLDTEITDASGFYEFDSLVTGDYRVRFVLPAGYDDFTMQDMGADAKDSDAGSNGETDLISIDTNFPRGDFRRDNPSIDAGILRYGSIGDYVWFDDNADGVQDNSEAAIEGAKVYLLDVLGNRIDSTTTNADGLYEFDSLLNGTYTVEFDLPDGFDAFTQTGAGTDETDNNAGTDGKSGPIVIDTSFPEGDVNRDNTTIDAGVVRYGSIGDYVWFDEDADGIQDAGEDPVKDVTVNLMDDGGSVIATTTTDGTGFYEFTGLNSGDYQVEFVEPAGYDGFTMSNEGTDDTADSDVGTDGKSHLVNIDVTKETTDTLRNNPNIDAGLIRYGSIGDFVWYDRDGDGIQDNNESGIGGVTVNLLDENDNIIETVVTGPNGEYLFDSLTTGDYKVQFVEPDGYDGFSEPLQGGNNAKDSNPDDTGVTSTISIDTNLPETNIGRNNNRIDAGLLRYGSLGDYVWFDQNRDGLQGAPTVELPIENVKVELLNGNGTLLQTTFTDANGFYEFDSLLSGNYRVRFTKPTGYDSFSQRNAGDDALDSDVDNFGLVTGITINTDLPEGDIGRDNPTIDAGLIQGFGSIGDYVWADIDKDGLQDGDEPGIGGVTVNLLDENGDVIETTTTNPDGSYLFDNLETGTYQVEVVLPPAYDGFTTANNPADDTQDSDVGTDGKSHLITIDNSKLVTDTLRNNPNIDAGLIPSLGSIGDYVWYDKDADGIQDPEEEGIGGVTVNLLDENGDVIATQTTEPDGSYLFDELPTGDYQVQIVSPDEFDGITEANAGTDDIKDSDFGTDGLSQIISIDNTKAPTDTLRNNPQVDAGLVRYGSIGDYVWYDEDADGVQDAEEDGIEGVTVNLLDESGDVIATTTTDADGLYEFDSLLSGTYQVEVVEPDGYNGFTDSEQGGDDTMDSNVDDAGLSQPIVIDTDAPSSSTDRNNPTIDAGLVRYGSIGDYVFFDEDGDGIQDADEDGIEGVTVNLLDGAGNVLETTTTNADGLYEFDSLVKGDYKIQVVNPGEYDGFTDADEGGDDTEDSDVDTTGESGIISIDPSLDEDDEGRNNPTVDAGLTRFGSIGDYVWLDNDKDGQQGNPADEPGVSGVTVNLLDDAGNILETTVTDANGFYEFDSLGTGDYQVEFEIPSGLSATTANSGDDTSDSDAGEDGLTHLISIDVTKEVTDTLRNNPNIDLGLIATGSLGDYVWQDNDLDGRQDNGEPPVEGVKVFLLNANENKLDSTVTDENGFYEFTGLESGDYRVQFELPEGTIATQQNAVEDTDDSDADANGLTRIYTIDTTKDPLNLQRNNPTVDLGIVPVGSIGDYVWFDEDGDGVQDADEDGVEGITVNLLDENGDVVATTTTDENGEYLFDNLSGGEYEVEFVSPDGQIFTTPNQGDETEDSDAGTDGKTGSIIIDTTKPIGDPARDNRDVDAGLVDEVIPYGSIGDYVWFDDDADGVQDADEEGIEGVTVNLLDENGNVLETTVTDADGKYLFDSLTTGNYQVEFVNDTGQPFTTADATDDANDSDAGADGKSPVISIDTSLDDGDEGRNNMTVDAGIIPPYGSIGDFVFFDEDGDGVQEPDEDGVEDVTVNLLDEDGNIIATTTTDENGAYLFDSLTTGTYEVEFVSPDGQVFTTPNQGDEAEDSDAGTDGKTGSIIIDTTKPIGDPARDNRDVDAGLVDEVIPYGSIGDYVWFDDNADGVQDADEEGIEGVTVNLLDENGNVLETTVTDTDGKYLFDSLTTGNYQVEFVNDTGQPFTESFKTNEAEDSNAGPDGKTGVISIDTSLDDSDEGRNNMTVDAGIIPPYGSIGDYVWFDEDGDGIQDADEDGVEGVTVNLLDEDGNVIASTTTDENGGYLFDSLTTGTYEVEFVSPDGQEFTTPNQGDEDEDSDAGTDGRTGPISIDTSLPEGDPGRDNTDVDAGLVDEETPLGSIGDFVFNDEDGDGVQDPDEEGVAGVTVNLLDDNGDVIATTTTDENGEYLFEDLPDGTYEVEFEAPAGTEFTTPNQGDEDEDSDAGVDGKTGPITIDTSLPVGDPGRDNRDVDAGIVTVEELGSIGDYVWIDADEDGVQDADEQGLGGVTMVLWTADGSGNPVTQLETTTTDENGFYEFDDLPEGRYIVQLDDTTLPTGAKLTSKDNSGDDATDSDFGRTGGLTLSPVVTLDPELGGIDQDNPTIDAGIIIPLGSIGDFVFNDEDSDGIQDADEDGVPGVTVNLLDESGDVIATTTTDENGGYLFENLPSGTYEIEFVAPAGTEFTTPNQGNEGEDSDAGVDGKTGPITIDTSLPVGDPGRDNRDVDAGIVTVEELGSIGDYVWFDADEDGVQDADEQGLGGVTMVLWTADGSGNPVTQLETTTTDENGFYEFDDLPEGRYIVQLDDTTLPTGAELTSKDNSGDDTTDSDFGRTGGLILSPVVTLDPELGGIDQDNPTIDAGVIVPTQPSFTDLILTKSVSTPTAQVGDIVSYTITLENKGTKDTANVEVIEALFDGAAYVSHTTTSGDYSLADKIWTTGEVLAGSKVELIVNVRIISGGAWTNSVRINDPNGPPTDSISVCLSVIIPICPERDETVMLSAPTGYTSYQWYNNNQPISGATGLTYEAVAGGSYTVKVNNGQCPAEGCCPVVIAEICECKAEICVPFVIKKVEK